MRGLVIILTENTIISRQNMIVMMLIVYDKYAVLIWNIIVGADMKRGCVIILRENIVISHDDNDENYVCIFNMNILEYLIIFQWFQKEGEVA